MKGPEKNNRFKQWVFHPWNSVKRFQTHIGDQDFIVFNGQFVSTMGPRSSRKPRWIDFVISLSLRIWLVTKNMIIFSSWNSGSILGKRWWTCSVMIYGSVISNSLSTLLLLQQELTILRCYLHDIKLYILHGHKIESRHSTTLYWKLYNRTPVPSWHKTAVSSANSF